MDIILYQTKDAPEVVNKKLTNELRVENVVFFREDYLDLLNPRVVLGGADKILDFAQYNFMRIPYTGRYYYINIKAENGLLILEGEVDVLKTWADSIYGSTQYLVRSEKYVNYYLADTMIPIHSDTDYDIKIPTDAVDVFDRSCNYVIVETIGEGGHVS